jgi:cytochrome c556
MPRASIGVAGLLDCFYILLKLGKGADDMRSLVNSLVNSLVKSRSVRLGLVTACVLASGSAAIAQDAPASAEEQADKAVHLRQSLFDLIEYSFAPVGGMLKNKVPFDAATAQKSAARVEALAPMISELFQMDTRKSTAKTRAREGIWTNKSDFTAKNDDLVKAAAALTTAAKGGDKKATMQAAVAVGKACGACHDNFREKQ